MRRLADVVTPARLAVVAQQFARDHVPPDCRALSRPASSATESGCSGCNTSAAASSWRPRQALRRNPKPRGMVRSAGIRRAAPQLDVVTGSSSRPRRSFSGAGVSASPRWRRFAAFSSSVRRMNCRTPTGPGNTSFTTTAAMPTPPGSGSPFLLDRHSTGCPVADFVRREGRIAATQPCLVRARGDLRSHCRARSRRRGMKLAVVAGVPSTQFYPSERDILAQSGCLYLFVFPPCGAGPRPECS